MSILTMRLLRLAVLLALLGGSLATATGPAAAQELDENVYTDEEYGWSVEFDDRVWTGEAVDEPAYRGLNLAFDDGFGTLAVYENGETDAAGCLDATVEDFEAGEAFLDFTASRSLDAPKSSRDAEGGVFTTTFASDETEIPFVFYIECREVDGGALNIQLAANEEAYEDSIPAFEELLGAIETGGSSTRGDDDTPTPDDDETPTPDDDETPTRNDPDPDAGVLDGDTFTDTSFNYSVSWDDAVWEAELLEGGNAAGVLLVADFATIVVDAFTGYEGVDADECVAGLADSFGDFEGYSSLTEERRIEGPKPPRDGAGAVYSFTFTNEDDEEFERVAYIECRPIDDESMIRISVQTNEELLEDNVDAFQEVLDTIQVAEADEKTPAADDETPEADDPDIVENDVDAGELDDDTFTDTALGYSVAFDDRVWTAELFEDAATAGVFLSTDDEELFATVTIDASLGYDGIDPEQCVEDYAAGYEDFDNYSRLREVRNADGPDAPRAAASAVYSFTFTYEDETEAELVAYIECRPIDDQSMVRVIIQTTEASLADNVDVFQEVLDGIEIDGGRGDDDETPDADDPLDTEDQQQG